MACMESSLYGQLMEQIAAGESIDRLRGLRDRLRRVLESSRPTLPVEVFYDRLNGAHDALIARVAALAEAAAERKGLGRPPVPYAYVLFGSGGRREQTPASDQDSGLIYDDPATEDGLRLADDYYRFLSERIVADLVRLGYPPCEGRVVSSANKWRGSLAEWLERLDGWFAEAEWDMVRQLLIVADGRVVYGSGRLLDAVKDRYRSDMLNRPLIVSRMLDNTMRHKVLLGVFGQLLVERYGEDAGGLDIKYGAYIPMVNAVRMLAVREGLRETSTLARIAKLEEMGCITHPEAHDYRDAFRLVLELRLLTSERSEGGLYESSGKLPAGKLTKSLAMRIKQSLRTGRRLQRRVAGQRAGAHRPDGGRS